MSTDEPFPTGGTPVTVGSAPGVAVPDPIGDDVAFSLYYEDSASGQPVRIQVPTQLGWTAAQVAEFAADVHVTDDAQRSHG